MLIKLTKHEFLSCARIAFPSYIIVLVLSLVGRFLTWLTSRQYILDNIPDTFVKIMQALSSLLSVLYVVVFMSLLILTLFMMIYRFYKNYFTDEGYLMLTLPTGTPSLISSKLINAWIWIFFSAVVALLSLWITLGHYEDITSTFGNLFDSIRDLIDRERDFIEEELGVPLWVFGVEIVVFIFAYITNFLLSWYASVSFGMLISKKHKIMGTLAAYFILYMVTTVINFVYLAAITTIVPDYYEILEESAGKALQYVILGSAVIYVIFSAGYFGLSSFILKRKLNLD